MLCSAFNILFAAKLITELCTKGMNELPEESGRRMEGRVQTNQETQSLRFCTSTKRQAVAAEAATAKVVAATAEAEVEAEAAAEAEAEQQPTPFCAG